jgi:hypothetical protein
MDKDKEKDNDRNKRQGLGLAQSLSESGVTWSAEELGLAVIHVIY